MLTIRSSLEINDGFPSIDNLVDFETNNVTSQKIWLLQSMPNDSAISPMPDFHKLVSNFSFQSLHSLMVYITQRSTAPGP